MRKLSKFLFGILMITNLCLTSCTSTSLENEEPPEVVTIEGEEEKVPETPDDD
ncbi:hypothetical protein Q4Q34_04185 [Flavivirga abyssicola]|uniref:hypothetical protein n=1 Tax=Flavivirga abyssicola TaxID=3063533 RepID=UPI0026DF06A2|nr:hypothetical protein [Flavivirga sp. MEBiC07777]WVK14226.1 hypothetical protein Q4Q34_04185 [Flavivirga sp. MEBiC07777]